MNTQLKRLTSAITCWLLLGSLASATEGNAKSTKGTVRTDDGLNVVYEIRGKGDTALVFLHGWCGDRTWWKHQADAFAGDYRVVTIDQAGHGESGKERKQWSVTGFATDVQAVVKELGLKRVILVGHSMGGPIALAAAKRLPGTVVAVIGVDTLQNAEYVWPEDRAKQILAGFEADFKEAMRAGVRGMLAEKVDPELLKGLTAKAEAQDPVTAIAILRNFPSLDAKALLKGAKVPVRCINSSGGFQYYQPTAIETNKKYADYNAVFINEVGHYPMLEKPAEFNQKLREVLKEFARKP